MNTPTERINERYRLGIRDGHPVIIDSRSGEVEDVSGLNVDQVYQLIRQRNADSEQADRQQAVAERLVRDVVFGD